MTKARSSGTSGKGPQRPTDRPRGGEARRIADLVPAIGDTAFRKFGFVQSAILTRWPEIVGPRLARVTRPESLRFPHGKKADGMLSIGVVGAHGPIVQHASADIIARVNRFFGYNAVARVRLTIAAPNSARVPEAVRPAASVSEVEAIPLSPTLNAIADPELRMVLEGLARSLAKRDGPPKIS